MYFIGVTTGASSIHRVFPRWAQRAGRPAADLVGADIPVGGSREQYRAVVEEIRGDPDAMGALVTTHKVQIYDHARDLFTDFDADAERLGEVSCIVHRGERLTGLAVDTLTAGLALRAIGPFSGHALILGAGGAAVALAVHLYRQYQPARVILTDISEVRLEQVRDLTPARLTRVSGPAENDRLLGAMPPGSLIVNATGMGKDRPGSPITPQARFPRQAVAWDFNYRGELRFLDYARAQGLQAVDGWEYFLHGWSQIMARVLGFDLTAELFAAMREAAAPLR
ncbi:MAG: shikimate dehydrogenase [Acidobacteria bacterium]|nr:shikimate dehydrogenase [Acidobacteriota bacterium]